ncbi:GNAT family N-acetyltransferase [Aureisphaera galaxeae]|uniref:GNAT family N-acetyltransferase n=1 Tax=Aureisphaera galaxeae TaxID=1538023 RepID=UPI0023507089|nr:GNAT family N-acetyltransferase [Aureisphaera galaxeae]MDC8004928.1 GNAT family N-acetyltransferase [Aureisphaera galaxeae]
MKLITQRLILKKITTADALFYVKLFNSEGWLKYIGDRNVHTKADAVAYIKKHYLPIYEKNGYGPFTVNLKDTGETIGACGLYKRDHLDHPDIGFAFLPDYIGKGYGYEAAKAVMEYAQSDLGLATILGFTVHYNKASIALLEKIGLKESGTFKFPDDDEELLLFSNES